MWKGDSLQPILPRQDNHLRIKSSKTKPNQTTKMFRGKELFNFQVYVSNKIRTGINFKV